MFEEIEIAKTFLRFDRFDRFIFGLNRNSIGSVYY